MPTRLTSSSILFMALLTSACGSSMKNPDIKQNPHPRMRYEITLTIEGAPGPFDSVTGFVQYKVANDRCVPLTPISGATLAPEKSLPLELAHVSDSVYRTTIYADLLQDADYYGLGICHWAVVAVSGDFKINALTFSPGIFHDDIVAQKSITRYFSDRSYKESDMQRIDDGNSNRSDFGSESKETFSITLAAKEDFP